MTAEGDAPASADTDTDTTAALPAPEPPPAPASRAHAPEWTMSVPVGVMQLAGLASIGAGAIHAGVAGLHAEQTSLARLFVVVAVAQIGVGLLALVKGGRLGALATILVNAGAVAAWGATRLWGIGWIDGLETAEDAAFTDTACAVLGAIAVITALVALVRRRTTVATVRLGVPAVAVGAVTLAAMLVGAEHTHSHEETEAAASGAAAAVAADGHTHTDEEEGATEVAVAARRLAAPVRPRPARRPQRRRGRDARAGAARHGAGARHAA